MSFLPGSIPLRLPLPRRSVRRAIALLVLGAVVATMAVARAGSARTVAGLQFAAQELQSLTGSPSIDHVRRAAIAWGYAERLRFGLESPFRLVESSARDSRLTETERHTVSWALLGRVVRGETHEVDAAALDLLGPWDSERSASGEQHLALISRVVTGADNPRAGELAVRLAYTLASAERLVDGSAPLLAAEAAAMIADRELARREAKNVVRSARGADPIAVVRERRDKRAFYVERPVLLSPSRAIEVVAIDAAGSLLDSLRSMRPVTAGASSLDMVSEPDLTSAPLRPQLFSAGARVPPSAAIAVTVQRYLPLVRSQSPQLADALTRVRNAEMLVATTVGRPANRAQRRVLGRMLLATAVAARSGAQEPAWFDGDSVPSLTRVASELGVASIRFDAGVPLAWRPYYVRSLADGVRDIRLVLPALRLDGLRVRFRMDSPADSALAMHDPRTRTLHLPVASGGGTLMHELAHDIDRQSAQQQGVAGYRSDDVARLKGAPGGGSGGRIAASLHALSEETRSSRAGRDRPAEVFATRVDWFVANALATQGISSGFVSAVQDELLTGHVVHPERLSSSGSSRSLTEALRGMTSVAGFATSEREPTAHGILHWVLAYPLDRRAASDVADVESHAWEAAGLVGHWSCEPNARGRAGLVRMAAESRARGWLKRRFRGGPDSARPAWMRGLTRQAPWSPAESERRVEQLRDHILARLSASDAKLSPGLAPSVAPLAAAVRCGAN